MRKARWISIIKIHMRIKSPDGETRAVPAYSMREKEK
jgi:hypothetical protein